MLELRRAARDRPALLPGVRRASGAAQRVPVRRRWPGGSSGKAHLSPVLSADGTVVPRRPTASRSKNATLTALAGIGLLLLAMGVGVLIGRSGSSKQAAAAPQVITVGGTAATGAGTEASFTSDWPSGSDGYTIQLETLPQSGTSRERGRGGEGQGDRQRGHRRRRAEVRRIREPARRRVRHLLRRLPEEGRSRKGPGGDQEVVPGGDGHRRLQQRLRIGSGGKLDIELGLRQGRGRNPHQAGAPLGAEQPERLPKGKATRKSPRTSPTWSKRASAMGILDDARRDGQTRPLRAGPAPRRRGSPAPGSESGSRRALRRRRDELAEQVTELHWDLGGLAYEMAIRDHFRLDVLVRRAAILQERDAELAEVERLLRMEQAGVAGTCPHCSAPHARGAPFCWQCGAQLMERLPSSALDGSSQDTQVMDELLAPHRRCRRPSRPSRGAAMSERQPASARNAARRSTPSSATACSADRASGRAARSCRR